MNEWKVDECRKELARLYNAYFAGAKMERKLVIEKEIELISLLHGAMKT